MFFKNLTCYRFGPEIDLDAIAAALPEHALRPVGPLELATHGFVPPLGDDAPYTHTLGDFILITVAQQERLLPSDVVNDELRKVLETIASTGDGRRVGAKERKRIKEEILTRFLPRAFVRTRKTRAYFSKDGWLVVDTGTRKVAEHIVTKVREAAGSFPCTPLAPEESPRALMTDWVIRGKMPDLITLGDQIELRDPAEAGAVVRCTNQDLESDEVREHLKSGKQVFRLALVFDDRISFVLDEALCLHKVRFLDSVQDELGDAETTEQLFDSQFALMTLELQRVLDWLATTFGVSAVPKLKLDGGDAPKYMRDQHKLERAVGLTAKMYAARKTAQEFLGHKFAETMASSAAAIKKRAKKDGSTDTEAAVALAKDNQNKNAGYTSLWILAALVEMTEPSEPPAAKPITNKHSEKLAADLKKSLKKSGINVSVDFCVGGDITELLNQMDRSKLSSDQIRWLESGHRGSSSETMFAKFVGINTAGCALSHPLDPDDLKRCRLLLQQVPEFEGRMADLVPLSPAWAELAHNWGTLCATMDTECPEWAVGKGSCPDTHEFMKQLGC